MSRTTSPQPAPAGQRDSVVNLPGRHGAHSFRALIDEIRPAVNRRLTRRLSRLSRRAQRYEVEATVDALSDLVMRGGKRFRAGLVVAAFRGVRPRAKLEPALDGAVAVELLHAYLLVQDDWMDGDDTRRGGPSVHAALARRYGAVDLGDRSAILASDFGWGLALQCLLAAAVPPGRVAGAIAAFAAAHEDVLLGQQLDVLGRAPDLERMHALKTESYTVRGPLLVGAALAGAGPPQTRALRKYAAPLGVAFQLRDDLLGVFAPERETGKPLGSDLRAGKRTAVTLAADPCLDRRGQRAYRAVFGHEQAGRAELLAAARHLERCGARAVVEQRLAELCELAARRAERLPLSARSRRWLVDAAALVAAPIPTAAELDVAEGAEP